MHISSGVGIEWIHFYGLRASCCPQAKGVWVSRDLGHDLSGNMEQEMDCQFGRMFGSNADVVLDSVGAQMEGKDWKNEIMDSSGPKWAFKIDLTEKRHCSFTSKRRAFDYDAFRALSFGGVQLKGDPRAEPELAEGTNIAYLDWERLWDPPGGAGMHGWGEHLLLQPDPG